MDFVIVKIPQHKECKYYQQAEDPEYVKQYNIPLDMLYYMEKQFWNAIRRKLEVLPSGFLRQCDNIIHDCRVQLELQNRLFTMRRQGMSDISQFFKSSGQAQPTFPHMKRSRETEAPEASTQPAHVQRRKTTIEMFFNPAGK